jgi:uncharacterized membrane protein
MSRVAGTTWRALTVQVLAGCGGAGLYAAVSWLTNYMQLSGTSDISLRPGIVIPIVFGLRFGPLAGFITGALGNTLNDLLSSGTTYWNWSLGNGLIGLVAGAYAFRWHTRWGWRQYAWAVALGCVGIAIGMAVAAGLDIWVCRAEAPADNCSVVPVTFDAALNQEFLPAAKTNVLNALILLPLLLFNLQNFNFGMSGWLSSGLLRRLMVAMMISAALPTVLLGWFLIQAFEQSAVGLTGQLALQITFTAILTLLFAFVNATLATQHLSKPLMSLTQAARQMLDSQLSSSQAAALAETPGDDEIAELSQVFGRMACEVIQREQALHDQVHELTIQIDEARRSKEVAEITDSEYFQSLVQRSQEVRARRTAQQSG